MSLDECEHSSGCVLLHAAKLVAGCPGEVRPVACAARTMGDREAALTIARDPQSQAWLFSDACVPEGWTDVSLAAPMCEP